MIEKQGIEDVTSELIQCCLNGDQAAYTELYEQYAPALYRLCYGLVLNRQDAEDVVQESFVYAFKNLARFDPEKAAFKTWLYTIALSRSRNVHRKKRLPTIDISQIFQINIAGSDAEQPEAVLAHRTAEDEIIRALAKLPSQLREAVILRYGHSLTFREVAEVMDCPPKTAESRVRLAHRRLHRLLAHHGQGLLAELLSS